MKIQENLVWYKHTGELIGFIDLGDPGKLATHVLVLIVPSLLNPLQF